MHECIAKRETNMILAEKTDTEILAVVEPLMDSVMEGSKNIDHATHTKNFTERMRSIVTPEHLEQVCTQYQEKWGYFTEREVVAVFRRQDSVAVVWRQAATKSSDEFVAEACVVEEHGRFLIDHAMIW